MSRTFLSWPSIIIASAAVTCLLALADLRLPFRPLIAFWFLLICPGMAFMPLLRLRDTFATVTLAVALSLALDTIVAGTLMYTSGWSPTTSLLILAALSVVGVLLQMRSARHGASGLGANAQPDEITQAHNAE
jgi:uncharacterized membrane protein